MMEDHHMATFNETMVMKLEAALTANVDVSEVTVDGITTRFTSRKNLVEMLERYRSLVAKDANTRPVASRISLGNWF